MKNTKTVLRNQTAPMILAGLHSTPKRILVSPNFIHLCPYFFSTQAFAFMHTVTFFLFCLNLFCFSFLTWFSDLQTSKQPKRGPSDKSSKVALPVLVETPQVQEDAKTKATGETSNIKTVATQDSNLSINLEENGSLQHLVSSLRTCDVADSTQLEETSRKPGQLHSPSRKG